jgi:hydroxypyruvate isomerase
MKDTPSSDIMIENIILDSGAEAGELILRRRSFVKFAGALAAHCATHAGGQALSGSVPFRLSVMLWTISPTLPLPQRLEQIAQAGYHCVELTSEYLKWSEREYRDFNRQCESLRLSVDAISGNEEYQSAPVSAVNPRDRGRFLASIQASIDAARRLNCPHIIIFSGRVAKGVSRERQHQSVVDGLNSAADLAEKHDVKLLLENIDLEEDPEYYLWSSEEGFRIIQEVNRPRIRFLYDCYHAQISEGNLIARLQKYIDLIATVHIADVPGRHEPGTGELNFSNIIRKLAELHYSGYVAMEFIPTGDPVQSLSQAREMALRAVASR